MRVIRYTAVILGLILAIILATAEIVCTITGATTDPALRMWTLTIVALALLGPLGLEIIDRQRDIIAMLNELVCDRRAERDFNDVERDFNDIKQRLGGQRNADGVIHLFPEAD
jgi:uncharacterized protein YacL